MTEMMKLPDEYVKTSIINMLNMPKYLKETWGMVK